MHLPAATLVLFPQHTPTAPYPSVWTPTGKKKKKRTTTRGRRRRRQTRSSPKAATANTTTGRSTNTSCTTRLRTGCSSTGWSRPQPRASGIWTDQSRGPWLTAGARHLRTTSHQAGPVLSAPRRDPSSRTAILTRRWLLRGILWASACADTQRSQVRRPLWSKGFDFVRHSSVMALFI